MLALALATTQSALSQTTDSGWSVRSIEWPVDARKYASPGVIHFENGRSFETGIFEPRIVGRLRTGAGAPYLLIAGRRCTECDMAELEIFVVSPDADEVAERPSGLPPGRLFARSDEVGSNDDVVTRLLFGRCLDADRDIAIWIQRVRPLGRTRWEDRVTLVEIDGNELAHRELTRREIAATSRQIVRRLRSQDCIEVPPLEPQ